MFELIVCLLIWLFLIYVLHLQYRQCGPTCGFYALVYAVNRLEKVKNKKKSVRELVIKCIEHNQSKMGEIFDINVFLEIASNYVQSKEIDAKIKVFFNIDDLKQILMQYDNVIIPYNCSVVHYAVLFNYEPNTGMIKIWNGNNYTVKKVSLREVYKKHCLIPNEFDWNAYYNTSPKPFRGKIWLLNMIVDAKLYLYLYKQFILQEHILNSVTQPISVSNRLLAFTRKI